MFMPDFVDEANSFTNRVNGNFSLWERQRCLQKCRLLKRVPDVVGNLLWILHHVIFADDVILFESGKG